VDLEMLCLHGPEGRCTNCLPRDAIDKRAFVTYLEWRERSLTRCEHAFAAQCVNCMPPSDVSYRLKPGCGRHRPWPGGLCSDCAPPTMDLRVQEYRHVDYVSVAAVAELGAFVELWGAHAPAGLQRAAFLYGRVEPDAAYRGGQRVVVEALYEPPQRWDAASGAVRLLEDAEAAPALAAVAGALGLTRVGWVFTKKPLLPGAPTVAPRELVAMAMLQLGAPRRVAPGASSAGASAGGAGAGVGAGAPAPARSLETGGSQFVTMVLRHTPDAGAAAARAKAPGACRVEGCGFDGRSAPALAAHVAAAHGGAKLLACDVPGCGYAAAREFDFSRHVRGHATEPLVLQASDKMCALVRDGVVAPPGLADTAVRLRVAAPGEPPVPDVVLVGSDGARMARAAGGKGQGVAQFEVEMALVKLESGSAAAVKAGGGAAAPRLRHASFPVENREELGVTQSPADVARHLAAHRGEPLQRRCSDFHLLLYVAKLLGAESARMLAEAVAADAPVPDGIELMLTSLA